MNLIQKIVLVIGAVVLLFVCFSSPPMHPSQTMVEPNPNHRPYDRFSSAYINVNVPGSPDYTLLFWRAFGVVCATGAVYALLNTDPKKPSNETSKDAQEISSQADLIDAVGKQLTDMMRHDPELAIKTLKIAGYKVDEHM